MISLQKVDNAIKFTFTDSQHYLYGDGVITVPVNSLLLVTDDSNMATFKKIDGDVFISALYSDFGMSKSELEAFYKNNMVGSTGGGGVTSGEVQTMIDESISGKADTSALTAYTLTSVTDALDGIVTAHTANTAIHVTVGDKLTWDGKQDALTAGSGITISGNVISADGGGVNVVQTTGTSTTDVMSQNAVTNALNSKGDSLLWDVNSTPLKYAELRLRRGVNTLSDAKLNLGDYLVYGSPVSSALNITGLTSESAFTAYTAATDAALSGKQDALTAGAGIDITNNVISATGGGSTYSAGTNISIANDTISCTLPITASTSGRKNDITIGNDITNGASDFYRMAIGNGNKFKYNSSRTQRSILIGTPSNNSSVYNTINGGSCIGIGGNGLEVGYDDINGSGSIGIGFGVKSLINNSLAIGYNAVASGTTKTNINNQLKIDTSNQIYIMDKDNANEICLQDYLGGGGSTYTAGEGISIWNDEISTSYSGYPVFDSGTTTPEMDLYDFEGQCLILCPIDCEGSTDGVASFSVDGHNYNFTFYPETQTYDDNGDSSWQDYFTLEWNNTYGAFMLTTNENQPINYAHDNGCVRFLTSEIRYSGTTTDGINGALDEINEVEQVTAAALNALNDNFGGLKLVKLTQQEYNNLSVKDSQTLYIIADVPFAGKWLATYTGGTTDSASCDSTSAITGNEITLTDLENLVIGDCVESIDMWAFDGATSLTSVTISDSVTSIGNYTFQNCNGLTDVTIGSGVTSIGEGAFATTNGSFTLTIHATTPPTLTNGIFSEPNGGIFVPAEAVQDYQNANIWSSYAQGIQPIQ